MIRLIILLFSIMSLQNGWATSRFYIIRINGVPVGSSRVFTVVDPSGNRISETQDSLTLRRGEDRILINEFSRQIETADLMPVSLTRTFKTPNLEESYTVLFDLNKEKGVYSKGKKQKVFPLSSFPYLNHKKQETFRKMIEKNIRNLKFQTFSSEKKGMVDGDILFKGEVEFSDKEKKDLVFCEDVKLFQFQQKEYIEDVMLITDYFVNNQGTPFLIRCHQMGICFEYVFQEDDGGAELDDNTEIPDMLELTSVTPVHYFPASYKVDQIEFEIQFKNTIPQLSMNTGFQKELYRQDRTITLLVKRPVSDKYTKAGDSAAYLKPSNLVQCDSSEILEVSEDLRKTACSDLEFIEKTVYYVYDTIRKKNFSVDFSDAVSVLKHKEGDCTEHSVLAIAILRAGKIPARGAIGMISVDGVFAYHMWVEVLLGNTWMPIDPTFNQTSADPSHIRFSHTSLDSLLLSRDFLASTHFINNVKIRPVKIKFVNGKEVNRFDMTVKDNNVCFYVADYCFETEEPLTVVSQKTDVPPVSFVLEKDGTHVKVEYYDLKYEGYSTYIIAQEALENSTISREMINEKRLVSGQSGESLIIFLEIESVLFKFTFSNTSDTMDMEAFKDRVYDFCLKMVNNHA